MSLLTTSKDASALGEASSELACCKKGWAKASSMDIRFFGSLLSNWEEDSDRDKEKDKSGVREADRDRDKEKDRSGVRDGDRDRDKEKDGSGVRDGDRDRDKKDRSGVRDGDRDRDKENDGSGVRDGGERERDNGGATRYTWYYEVEYYEVGGMKV